MKNQRGRKVANYVVPTVLSQCAFFLFTIVAGVIVSFGGSAVVYGLIIALGGVICAIFITRRSERGGVRFSED